MDDEEGNFIGLISATTPAHSPPLFQISSFQEYKKGHSTLERSTFLPSPRTEVTIWNWTKIMSAISSLTLVCWSLKQLETILEPLKMKKCFSGKRQEWKLHSQNYVEITSAWKWKWKSKKNAREKHVLRQPDVCHTKTNWLELSQAFAISIGNYLTIWLGAEMETLIKKYRERILWLSKWALCLSNFHDGRFRYNVFTLWYSVVPKKQ